MHENYMWKCRNTYFFDFFRRSVYNWIIDRRITMRKWIGLFLIILFLGLIHSENVFAAEAKIPIAEDDLLVTSSDFEEIQLLENDIRNNFSWFTDGVPESIDFSQAVKIYVDTDLVNLKSTQQEVLFEALSESNYVWVVPLKVKGECYSVTIARGLPYNGDNRGVLTEEDIEHIRSMEGKWHITETMSGGAESYYSQLMNYGDEILDYDRIIIVSGQPGMRMPIAIGFSDGEARSWISLGYSYPVISDAENTSGNNKGIYDFETIAKPARRYDDRCIVENPLTIWFYIIAIFVCAVVIGILIMRYIKKKHAEHLTGLQAEL